MSRVSWSAAVALVALAVAAPVSGQLALRGGINLTNLVGSDAGNTDPVRGLNLGASLGLLEVSRFQIQAEVYYRQKGASGSLLDLQTLALAGAAGGEPESLEIGLDYVEIPLLARINLGSPGKKWLPYLFGGPAFGWRLNCGVSISASSEAAGNCDDLTQNLERTLRSYETGLVLGGGIDFVIPGSLGAINLDARYTGGLSKVGEGADALDVRNQAFTVMLGYAFSIPGSMRPVP